MCKAHDILNEKENPQKLTSQSTRKINLQTEAKKLSQLWMKAYFYFDGKINLIFIPPMLKMNFECRAIGLEGICMLILFYFINNINL